MTKDNSKMFTGDGFEQPVSQFTLSARVTALNAALQLADGGCSDAAELVTDAAAIEKYLLG